MSFCNCSRQSGAFDLRLQQTSLNQPNAEAGSVSCDSDVFRSGDPFGVETFILIPATSVET